MGELRRRKIFISDTTGINRDISNLRSNLDESLQNITSSSYNYRTSAELGKTLNRESSKLQELGQKYQHVSYSNSKITSEQIQANIPITKAKRTLSFENIIS